ncbi:MAG: Wzz/FepE/Etk N-terminal domain-containing protein [Burkholderiales bacterium]|jgi:tyrosine-protein kinase Etk/Wzc
MGHPDLVPLREASLHRTPDTGFGLLDLMVLLAENARRLALVPIACGLVALGITFLVSPTYTAVARILPPQQQGGAAALLAAQLGSLASLAAGAAGLKNPSEQYVGILKGRTIGDAIIERFDLRRVYDLELMETTRRMLASRVDIGAGLRDGIISIEVDDEDPKRAADIANGYVAALRELSRSMSVGEASQRREFFERRLAQARASLAVAEAALQGSRVDGSTLKAEPRAAIEEVARLKAAVTVAEVKLGVLRGYMSEANPDLRLAMAELAALRTQLARAERGDRGDGAAGGPAADYVARYRDFKYNEVLFELIAKQYELARLDEARDTIVIQVIDVAAPPDRKSRPLRALTAIVTTVAVFFLMLAALVMGAHLKLASDRADGRDKVARIRRALSRRAR